MKLRFLALAICFAAIPALYSHAQAPATGQVTPSPQPTPQNTTPPQAPAAIPPGPPTASQTMPQGGTTAPAPPAPQVLNLHDAEILALQNHPRIQVAQNLAEAARQQIRQVRSVYYPQATASITGSDAANPDNTRIGAGGLNSPHVFDREGDGFAVSQLITDFGHTHQLSKSSEYHAQAQQENVVTSRADVLLAVDEAYFQVLRSEALLRVAQQTVGARQLVSQQITTMARNQLKSDLDVSFANVNLSESQLLLIQAQNALQASFAALSTALGYNGQRTFTVAEEPLPAAPPADPAPLIAQAIQSRPELVSLRLDVNSANSYALAERDLFFPTISAIGVAGLVPAGSPALPAQYAAVGGNVSIPIFNGHLFGALYSEAKARLTAQQQSLRDESDLIARDVQTAWLNANSAYQRLAVTDQLLMEATQAMNLSQARYNLGLSSIIEVTQAQLNLTQAEIDQASAKYDYQIQTSTLNYAIGNLR